MRRIVLCVLLCSLVLILNCSKDSPLDVLSLQRVSPQAISAKRVLPAGIYFENSSQMVCGFGWGGSVEVVIDSIEISRRWRRVRMSGQVLDAASGNPLSVARIFVRKFDKGQYALKQIFDVDALGRFYVAAEITPKDTLIIAVPGYYLFYYPINEVFEVARKSDLVSDARDSLGVKRRLVLVSEVND